METRINTVISQTGVPIQGATITIFEDDEVTVSSIFEDDGTTPKSNPFVTGQEGEIKYSAANGKYVESIVVGSSTKIIKGIVLFDPSDTTTGDENVKVSNDDTTTGKLEDKITVGSGITMQVVNDGADEDLEFSADPSVYPRVSITASDTSNGFLNDKLVGSNTIGLTIIDPGTSETFQITILPTITQGDNSQVLSNDENVFVRDVIDSSGNLFKEQYGKDASGNIFYKLDMLSQTGEIILEEDPSGNYGALLTLGADVDVGGMLQCLDQLLVPGTIGFHGKGSSGAELGANGYLTRGTTLSTSSGPTLLGLNDICRVTELTGNHTSITFNTAQPVSGTIIEKLFIFKQDATGSRTVDAIGASGIDWASGASPKMPQKPNAVLIVKLRFDGSRISGEVISPHNGKIIEETVASAAQTNISLTDIVAYPNDLQGAVNYSHIQVFKNGLLQREGGGNDYTVSFPSLVQFNVGLALDDVVVVYQL